MIDNKLLEGSPKLLPQRIIQKTHRVSPYPSGVDPNKVLENDSNNAGFSYTTTMNNIPPPHPDHNSRSRAKAPKSTSKRKHQPKQEPVVYIDSRIPSKQTSYYRSSQTTQINEPRYQTQIQQRRRETEYKLDDVENFTTENSSHIKKSGNDGSDNSTNSSTSTTSGRISTSNQNKNISLTSTFHDSNQSYSNNQPPTKMTTKRRRDNSVNSTGSGDYLGGKCVDVNEFLKWKNRAVHEIEIQHPITVPTQKFAYQNQQNSNRKINNYQNVNQQPYQSQSNQTMYQNNTPSNQVQYIIPPQSSTQNPQIEQPQFHPVYHSQSQASQLSANTGIQINFVVNPQQIQSVPYNNKQSSSSSSGSYRRVQPGNINNSANSPSIRVPSAQQNKNRTLALLSDSPEEDTTDKEKQRKEEFQKRIDYLINKPLSRGVKGSD